MLPRLAFALLLSFAVAGAIAPVVRADDVFQGKDHLDRPMAIRLHTTLCPASVTKWLPMRVRPEFHEAFKAATLHWDGRDWDACWLEMGGEVFVIDEEGVVLNQGAGVPRRLFKDPNI